MLKWCLLICVLINNVKIITNTPLYQINDWFEDDDDIERPIKKCNGKVMVSDDGKDTQKNFFFLF